jgi:ParB family transcriptional regulator, chromosome partitioning protein
MSLKGIANLAELMEAVPTGIQEVALSLIDPDPHQPRTSLDESRLQTLAASVAAQGVIEPLIVSAHPETPGRYLLVAGERRWRAAGLAGLTTVAVVVRELTPEQRLAVQLIENIDREDLSVLEEAAAVVRLIDFGRKPKDVADMLGKTPAWVSLRRKIETHRERLECFVLAERTRDAETLAMLVDLEKIDGKAFIDLQGQERITRGAVREAIELAKRRKLALLTPGNLPEVPLPTGQQQPADPAGQSQPEDGASQGPQTTPEPQAPAAPTEPAAGSASSRSGSSRPVDEGNGQNEPTEDHPVDRYEEVRHAMQVALGLTVQLVPSETGEGGQVRIDFADLAELEALCKAMSLIPS